MITVLIAEDHPLLREGLRLLLELEEDIQVIGEALNGREAVDLAAEHHPDVVLMDVQMPFMDGIEATRLIRSSSPGTSVLMISALSREEVITQAISAGASGFVSKQTTLHNVPRAIREVCKGNGFFGLN
jgi:DNA-binding NarL/FixJ family response regulator